MKSHVRAPSGNRVRPKKLVTLVLVVSGVLGLLKTIIEYIKTAVENRSLHDATNTLSRALLLGAYEDKI